MISLDRRQFVGALLASEASLRFARGGAPRLKKDESQSIVLADGRRLGFAEYGDPTGTPILYFHGLPASRLEARFTAEQAQTEKCRLISVDRPGIGLSDPLRGRNIEDWPSDVLQLLDHLKLGRFAMIGFSSGAPYALACAAQFSESSKRSTLGANRSICTMIISGVGPVGLVESTADRYWQMISRRPRLAEKLLQVGASLASRNPRIVMERINRSMAQTRDLLALEPRFEQMAIDAFLEGTRQGARGIVADAKTLTQPWRLRLDRCRGEVYFWYGVDDRITPPAIGEYLSEQIPQATLYLLPGECHYSMPLGVNVASVLGACRACVCDA